MAQNGRLDGHPARVAVQTSILCHTFLCVAQGNQSMRNSSMPGLELESGASTACSSRLPWYHGNRSNLAALCMRMPLPRSFRHCAAHTHINLEPGPSALRWLLGDDDADRAWGRVKITSQLIGYFEGKAVLPRIYFRTAGGHCAVAKLSLVAQVWSSKVFAKPSRHVSMLQHA